MLDAFPTFEMPCLRVMKYWGQALFVCLASAHPADGRSRSQQWRQDAEKKNNIFLDVKGFFFLYKICWLYVDLHFKIKGLNYPIIRKSDKTNLIVFFN